jgi:2-oxoglutarate ferredoxin oxidoreductase subunit beta
MAVVFEKPKALADVSTHYCPGCTHGIIHRLVAEVIDEMGIEGDTIGVCPVGCSVMAYNYFNCDMIEAPHGRAPAVATGAKRAMPINMFLHIRVMVTLLQLVLLKQFIVQPEEKI